MIDEDDKSGLALLVAALPGRLSGARMAVPRRGASLRKRPLPHWACSRVRHHHPTKLILAVLCVGTTGRVRARSPTRRRAAVRAMLLYPRRTLKIDCTCYIRTLIACIYLRAFASPLRGRDKPSAFFVSIPLLARSARGADPYFNTEENKAIKGLWSTVSVSSITSRDGGIL